jgi:hypothetical protein
MSLPCSIFNYLLFLGEGCFPFAGVVDGGDIASVKFTGQKLNCSIKDQTCICHQMNNIIKKLLTDYFEEIYLNDWRAFVKRIRQSNPFSETWDFNCEQCYSEKRILQVDTPTRWSSTIMMLQKATTVKAAVERMFRTAKSEDDKVLLLFLFFF